LAGFEEPAPPRRLSVRLLDWANVSAVTTTNINIKKESVFESFIR